MKKIIYALLIAGFTATAALAGPPIIAMLKVVFIQKFVSRTSVIHPRAAGQYLAWVDNGLYSSSSTIKILDLTRNSSYRTIPANITNAWSPSFHFGLSPNGDVYWSNYVSGSSSTDIWYTNYLSGVTQKLFSSSNTESVTGPFAKNYKALWITTSLGISKIWRFDASRKKVEMLARVAGQVTMARDSGSLIIYLLAKSGLYIHANPAPIRLVASPNIASFDISNGKIVYDDVGPGDTLNGFAAPSIYMFDLNLFFTGKPATRLIAKSYLGTPQSGCSEPQYCNESYVRPHIFGNWVTYFDTRSFYPSLTMKHVIKSVTDNSSYTFPNTVYLGDAFNLNYQVTGAFTNTNSFTLSNEYTISNGYTVATSYNITNDGPIGLGTTTQKATFTIAAEDTAFKTAGTLELINVADKEAPFDPLTRFQQ